MHAHVNLNDRTKTTASLVASWPAFRQIYFFSSKFKQLSVFPYNNTMNNIGQQPLAKSRPRGKPQETILLVYFQTLIFRNAVRTSIKVIPSIKEYLKCHKFGLLKTMLGIFQKMTKMQ